MNIVNPISALEQAQNAIANGDIRKYALLAYQAATWAVHNAAGRLDYPINDESDVHRFLLALDGVPPPPQPDADDATVAAWIVGNSHIPPIYSAPHAVAEGLHIIADVPDGILSEAADSSYDAAQYDLTLLSIRDFIDNIATATPPESAS